MRYDACVIGAGADGLAAAATLAKAGFKTIVIENGERPGGRLAIREFHPGFHASPYCDELAPIPTPIFRSLDLARKGALFAPTTASLAIWPDRRHRLDLRRPSQCLLPGRVADALARASRDAEPPARRRLFARPQARAPWPGEDGLTASMVEMVAREIADPDAAAHIIALALQGRAADPFLRGSALHFFAPGFGGSGLVTRGLADALAAAARETGAEILCNAEIADIRQAKGRVSAVGLADGSRIEARAVLSTLDLKHTFLSLFPWDALPKPVARRVSTFRMAGSTARLLLALDRPPDTEALHGPIHVAPGPTEMAQACAAWRDGTIADHPPLMLRILSASDPSFAPAGQAVLTATLGCIPPLLFDGAWTHGKRDALRDRAFAAIESVLPGTLARIVAAELILPPDIEGALGASGGDLWGGEIAADQIFDLRPGFATASPRTPIAGLYLAGPSSAAGPLGSCASGVIAAQAMIADLGRSR